MCEQNESGRRHWPIMARFGSYPIFAMAITA
jgi:hypothetical protein